MKKFNKTIQVEFEVDYVANQFLNTLKEDLPHRELIAETVVGTLLERDGLSNLLSSMNGWKKEYEVEVGKTYSIAVKDLRLYNVDKTKGERTNVQVDEINEYKNSTRKIKVSGLYYQEGSSKVKEFSEWVEPTDLSLELVVETEANKNAEVTLQTLS